MDIKINFDLNAITGFFKKNKMLVLPMGICIIALVLLVPTKLIGNSVKKKTEASVNNAKNLDSMIRSDTSYSTDQASIAEQQFLSHKQDSQQVVSLARQTTQRELISYDIFPAPKSKSQQIYTNFGKAYRSSIESLLNRIRALDAPTNIEKDKATAHLGRTTSVGRPVRGGSQYNQRSQNPSVNAVIKALCEKRASSIPVYANISVFKWHGFWGDFKYAGEETAVSDCWNSQLAFWVYEDIVSTIESMNSDSSSVASSPVKRLLDISFSEIVNGYSISRNSGDGISRRSSSLSKVRDVPEYVMDGKGKLVSDNWTGRSSNKEINVIQFSFSVVLDSASVSVFMKDLCSEKTHKYKAGYSKRGGELEYKHNQIGILRYSLEPIEREYPGHSDYRYGDHSVVTLSLVCEYIFNKGGYAMIMPKVIYEKLYPPVDLYAY
jgi:hypothetical protein